MNKRVINNEKSSTICIKYYCVNGIDTKVVLLMKCSLMLIGEDLSSEKPAQLPIFFQIRILIINICATPMNSKHSSLDLSKE